jgi:hypothetical protein
VERMRAEAVRRSSAMMEVSIAISSKTKRNKIKLNHRSRTKSEIV